MTAGLYPTRFPIDTNTNTMFKTFVTLIFRNWWRNKTFACIAILSLTVGIAFTNMLVAFVTHEYNIEYSNPNKERIIWTMQDLPSKPGEKVAYMQSGIPDQLKEKYPEVEDYLQLNSLPVKYIEVGYQSFDPIEIINVNPSFPLFFPFELLYGSWNTFDNPRSIALSEKQAGRLFGKQNAIGEEILLGVEDFDGKVTKQVYVVNAVVKDRSQSAVNFDGLIYDPESLWGGATLLLMTQEADLKRFEAKVNEDKVQTLAGGKYFFIRLDNALSTTYNQQILSFWHCRKDNLLMVGLISAILVLFIAVFNYLNMSLSRVIQQQKTLQTQKLMGATQREIRIQLFGDLFFMVIIAFLLSLLLMNDFLPIFNKIVSSGFSSSYFYSKEFFPYTVSIALFLAITASLFISLKLGRVNTDYSKTYLVKQKNRWVGVLVSVQFVIAIVLLIAMFTANSQLQLLERGGDRYRNVVELNGDKNRMASLKSAITSVSGVTGVSTSDVSLLNSWIMHADMKKEDGAEFQSAILQLSGDTGLIRVLKIEQIAGDPWIKINDKYSNAVFVNKAFVDLVAKSPQDILGEPLKKYVDSGDTLSVIAGVVSDFYINSLEEKILPVVITQSKTQGNGTASMQIRLDGSDNNKTIHDINLLWRQYLPDEYFSYTEMYETFIKRNGKIIEMTAMLRMYSIISVILICFGLFGISYYSVRQRTKEIAIQKINGAKTYQVVGLLVKPVFLWIAISSVVAVPLACVVSERWLQEFAYRIDISVYSCLGSLLLVSIVSLASVSAITWKSALSNPVDSLRR